MENQPTKLDKAIKIATLAGIIIVSLSIAYFFIYKTKNGDNVNKNNITVSNQNSEEAQAKKDFTDSLNLRIVGNCDSFADSVSKKDTKIREVWGEKCRQEKEDEAIPLSDFSIKRILVENEKAYIQARLTRSDGKDRSYTVSYELVKEGGKWKLIMPDD